MALNCGQYKNWRRTISANDKPGSWSGASLRHRFGLITSVVFTSLSFAGCVNSAEVDLSPGHLTQEIAENQDIPAPVAASPVLPEPIPVPVTETYSVVVKDVPVADILFSLARDAGLNLDMQPGLTTPVTINAVEQPLPQILHRLCTLANLRYEMFGPNLLIEADTPYWHNYRVDYVNITRTSDGEVGVATEISTTGGSVGEESSGSRGEQGNVSRTTVKNKSNNDFWSSIKASLEAIVSNPDATGAADASVDPIAVNTMAGIISVRTSQQRHRQVQSYIDAVSANTQRQVLIEMTIVEVELSDRFQAGVDWQRLSDLAGAGSNGPSVSANLLGANLTTPPSFSLGYNSNDADGSSLSATVRALQQFGDTKVLSSPKIMALNNQTALLKVVDEEVYFTVDLDIREATADIPERRTFTSEVHTIPVGLVMAVTPQISASGLVSLNIRPTISRITGFAIDPAPRLANADFDNLIPEIQVREIESLLQVANGRTVVLGGLMQNRIAKTTDGIPGLSRIPKLGKLFSYTDENLIKTELVIFLRPTVVTAGGDTADKGKYSAYLPTSR